MTIEQTIEIPPSRRLYLDLEIPREIPEGKARLEMKVIPFIKDDDKPVEDKPVNKGKLHLTKKELDEMLKDCPITQRLLGILSDLGDVDLDEIRMARLAKHL